MDALTAVGLFAVTAMLVLYALEDRSHWLVLAFAGACVLGSGVGFLQGAWAFGVLEAIWAVVAFRRWYFKNEPGQETRNVLVTPITAHRVPKHRNNGHAARLTPFGRDPGGRSVME